MEAGAAGQRRVVGRSEVEQLADTVVDDVEVLTENSLAALGPTSQSAGSCQRRRWAVHDTLGRSARLGLSMTHCDGTPGLGCP